MLLVLAKRWFWMWTHLANSFLWPFTLHLPIFDELIVHFRRIRQIKSPSLKKVSEGGRGGEGREQERKSQFQLSSSCSRLKAEYPKRDPAQLLSLFLIDQLKETSFPWICFVWFFFLLRFIISLAPAPTGRLCAPIPCGQQDAVFGKTRTTKKWPSPSQSWETMTLNPKTSP